MEKAQELFADGVGEITLAGGMVRMDLICLVGSQRSEDDKPRFEVRQRVVMPPDGFLRSFGAMEDLVKQLVKAGLVKPREGNPDAAADGAAEATAGKTASEPPKSPNF